MLAGVDAGRDGARQPPRASSRRRRKLFEVCQAATCRCVTFLNKIRPSGPRAARAARRDRGPHRPAPDAGDLAGPGIAEDLRGVIDRRTGELHPLHPHRPAAPQLAAGGARRQRLVAMAERGPRAGGRAPATSAGCSTPSAPTLDLESFLAGDCDARLFFGSALTNFGVRMLLDAIVDLGADPVAASTEQGRAAPARGAVVGVRVQGPGEHGPVAPRPTWRSPASARAASSAA